MIIMLLLHITCVFPTLLVCFHVTGHQAFSYQEGDMGSLTYAQMCMQLHMGAVQYGGSANATEA